MKSGGCWKSASNPIFPFSTPLIRPSATFSPLRGEKGKPPSFPEGDEDYLASTIKFPMGEPHGA
jgi:hypothetical protein